jgi:transposase
MSKTGNKSVELREKHNRNFSEEFKRAQVKAISGKQISVAQLCRLHGISRTSVYNWIYLYSPTQRGTRTVTQMESEQQKTLQLYAKLAEYERIIGQKQMEIDILNKTIELASDEVGYDIKKKRAPASLNGFVPTPTNTVT